MNHTPKSEVVTSQTQETTGRELTRPVDTRESTTGRSPSVRGVTSTVSKRFSDSTLPYRKELPQGTSFFQPFMTNKRGGGLRPRDGSVVIDSGDPRQLGLQKVYKRRYLGKEEC